MKLTNDQIRAITTGAVEFEETEDYLLPHRYTAAQRDFFLYSDIRHDRCTTATGICFHFDTDSTTLTLDVECLYNHVRAYFSFEVYANDQLVGYLDNFSDIEVPEQCYYCPELAERPTMYRQTFSLGKGPKRVRVIFPWSKMVHIRSVELDDGAYVTPVKRAKTLITHGDSITHGWEAPRPSQRYAAMLADFLGADEYCKAMGGEVYCPDLADCPDPFVPDYISVAYGANDWCLKTYEEEVVAIRGFYENLVKHYPQTPIFVITPIWRVDHEEEHEFGEFIKMEETICQIAADFPQIQVIRGYDLVPHEAKYFVDELVHPTPEGFAHYGKNLCAQLKLLLNK